jgi:2-keto-4-pentenoate hydratase/2-oxohepta-3-ene-1,7-dioic acid hydratase in catechol pathway
MKIVRFRTCLQGPQYGWLDIDKVGVIQGDIFGEYRRFDPEFSLDEVELLLPCQPSKVIGVGLNYTDHIREMGSESPQLPLLFLKPPSSMITNGQPIVLPPISKRVEHEAELAIIIGKRGRYLDLSTARDAIFGYSIANDVTARDLQASDGQWTRAKGFDTFCPFGPWIETELDASDALITCHVNNSLRQMASTRDMLFDPLQLVVFISSVMTLNPGDVILSGTPSGVGPLEDSDTVSIHIDGIGSLINTVKAADEVLG